MSTWLDKYKSHSLHEDRQNMEVSFLQDEESNAS